MSPDVVICGFGPTGATAANLLGQRGVRTLALDASEEIYDIPRAVHFDGETMRVFQALGLSEQINDVSGTASRLRFVNGWGLTLMSANVRDVPRLHGWPNGNFFNQPMLERHLRDGAARFPSVEVRLGWELESFEQDEDGVTVRIRQRATDRREEIRTRYLLGADGACSPTRTGAGIELEDLECDEPWLVCDLILDGAVEIERTIYQVCDPRRPTTLVPCEGRHIRWEFMLRPGDDPETLERTETVHALMAPHMHRLARGLRPDQGRLIRSKVYTFHGLIAKDFRAGRAFVMGDAAHQTPPFLGQGLCAGIRDAYNLCWKLHGVLEGRYEDSLLDTYTSERRPHAHRVVRQAIRTGTVIQTTNRWKALTRDVYFTLSRLIPALRRPFSWAPRWALGPGLFDASDPPTPDSAHGHPLDQPSVETAAGTRVWLDDVLGSEFSVIGLGVDPSKLVDESAARSLRALGARCLHVGPGGDVVDVDGTLSIWSERVGGGRLVVLRPDRQVFGVYGSRDGADEAALGAELSEGIRRLAGAVGLAAAREQPA